MRPFFLLMMALLLGGCAMAQGNSTFSTARAVTDAGSLRECLFAMLRAHQKGDTDTFEALINGLKMSNPTQWFSNTFSPEQTDTLVAKYEHNFLAYRSQLTRLFEWAGDTTADVSVEKWDEPHGGGASASPTAPVPKTPVEIDRFKTLLKVPGKGRKEWVCSFIRENGQLRFIGEGGFPFWAGPFTLHTRKPN